MINSRIAVPQAIMQPAPTPQRTAVLVLACVTVLFGACHRVAVAPSEMANRVTIGSCPPGVVPVDQAEAPPLALLRLNFEVTPAVTEGAEAIIRLDGETTRSSIRVDPTTPMSFSLSKGVYVVRVQLSGYTGVEGRVPLTAGCEAVMNVQLKKDVPK